MNNIFTTWKHPCSICGKEIGDKRTIRCMECFLKIKCAPPKERFERFIRILENGCWEWKGFIQENGYGIFKFKDQSFAHRSSWIIYKGAIPKKLQVLHKCDKRSCVNPDHLFLGTQSDNVRDCINKNRRAIGENHGRAILSTDQVIEIRKFFDSKKMDRPQLQEHFGVGKWCIYSITKRLTWKHII